MPYHCHKCYQVFSIKHGIVMQSFKLGYQNGALAIYLMTVGIKSTSSLKLYRDIGVN